VRLELGTFDICCLAALHLRTEREGLTSVPDDLLVDLFEQVCDLVDAGAEQPRKRATHAIGRLLEQRLLLRVDAAGIASAGEYALASLATHIAKAFLDDDALTRESLTLLTGTLLSHLAEVKGAAARADSPQVWAERVIGPLRVTVLDLVGGIDRRQRGLDAEQDEVRSQIAGLLQQDWFDAVDRAGAARDHHRPARRAQHRLAARRASARGAAPGDPGSRRRSRRRRQRPSKRRSG
jgi:chromosome partition protein MukF